MQIYLHMLLTLLLVAGLVTITIGFFDWLSSRKNMKHLKDLAKWDGQERRKCRGLDKTTR